MIQFKFVSLLLVTLIAVPAVFLLRGHGEEWRKPLAEIKRHVLPVDKPGGIPRSVKEVRYRCEAEILQRDAWSMAEANSLFEMLDRGLSDLERFEPDSNDYAFAQMVATAPIHAIEARFHYGAPVDPEVAAAIHDRFVRLMRHKSWSLRLTAASGAIHGYMENSPAVRRQLEAMTKDDEPLVAAVCRRFVQEQNSAEVTRMRSLKQAQRGY